MASLQAQRCKTDQTLTLPCPELDAIIYAQVSVHTDLWSWQCFAHEPRTVQSTGSADEPFGTPFSNERQKMWLAEKCQLQRDSPGAFQTFGPSGSSLKKYLVPKGQHASQGWPSRGVKGTAEGRMCREGSATGHRCHTPAIPNKTPLLPRHTLFSFPFAFELGQKALSLTVPSTRICQRHPACGAERAPSVGVLMAEGPCSLWWMGKPWERYHHLRGW